MFLYTPLEIEEPTSFQKTIYSPKQKEWMKVMGDEIESIATNEVCEFVDLPPWRKSIRNKVSFQDKTSN